MNMRLIGMAALAALALGFAGCDVEVDYVYAADTGICAEPVYDYVCEVVVSGRCGYALPDARVGIWLENTGALGHATTGYDGVASFIVRASPGTTMHISIQAAGHLPVAIADTTGDSLHLTYAVALPCD